MYRIKQWEEEFDSLSNQGIEENAKEEHGKDDIEILQPVIEPVDEIGSEGPPLMLDVEEEVKSKRTDKKSANLERRYLGSPPKTNVRSPNPRPVSRDEFDSDQGGHENMMNELDELLDL